MFPQTYRPGSDSPKTGISVPAPEGSPEQNSAHASSFLFVLVVTVGTTLLGLLVIGLVCHFTVPPIPGGFALEREVTVSDNFFYLGQPWKTAVYNRGCLALPFLLAIGFWSGNRLVQHFSHETLDRLTWLCTGLYLLLVAWSAWPMVSCPDPPLPTTPPSWFLLPFHYSQPFLTPWVVISLTSGMSCILLFASSRARRRHARWVFLLLLAIWLALIPSRFYASAGINDEVRYTYHLNSTLDALSQSVNGHHLLVDFPHIYGGYGEMLAVLIRPFPRSPGVLLAALALPNILGVLCLLLTARLIIRHPAYLFLSGLALLGVDYLTSGTDLTYGYSTARMFFPPMGLLAATLYFRRPNHLRYALATGVAALASLWNLDTGLVLWGCWLTTLVAMQLVARRPLRAMQQILVQTLSLGAAWTFFLLYLRACSGQWPDLGMLFYFQRFVLGTGYSCVPLICPDMWVPVLSIYAVGLAIVVRSCAGRAVGWRTPTILMISLLGIGISSYFLGRSAESNLAGVAYPAVLLAGIFCAGVDTFTRRPEFLPVSARLLVLPSKLALFWWSFLLLAGLPDLLVISGGVIRAWSNSDQTPFRANAAFVAQKTSPQEDSVFFLSNHSGFYYYLTVTVRPLKMPGMIELMRTQDMNILLNALRDRRIKKLFVEENFYSIKMYRPDIYQEVREAIARNYRVSETGPTGKLVLYTPR